MRFPPPCRLRFHTMSNVESEFQGMHEKKTEKRAGVRHANLGYFLQFLRPATTSCVTYQRDRTTLHGCVRPVWSGTVPRRTAGPERIRRFRRIPTQGPHQNRRSEGAEMWPPYSFPSWRQTKTERRRGCYWGRTRLLRTASSRPGGGQRSWQALYISFYEMENLERDEGTDRRIVFPSLPVVISG